MPELATELWLKIIEDLPKSALTTLSLANRYLRTLCEPLLYSNDIVLRPYAFSSEHAALLVGDDEAAAARARMEFFCSDRIAALVRVCTIEPWKWVSRPDPGPLAADPFEILAIFLRQLPAFMALRDLSLRIEVPSPGEVDLGALPHLKRLEVDFLSPSTHGTASWHPEPGTILQLESFTYRGPLQSSLVSWAASMKPSALHELAIHGSWPPLMDESSVSAIERFTELKKLVFVSYAMSIADSTLPSLKSFSTLTELTINIRNVYAASLPSDISLPFVHKITANLLFLPVLLRRATTPRLATLHIPLCSNSCLLEMLQALKGCDADPARIKHLVLDLVFDYDFSDMDPFPFDSLATLIPPFFPHLKTLRMQLDLHEGYYDLAMSTGGNIISPRDSLVRGLPTTLAKLSVTFNFPYLEGDEMDAEALRGVFPGYLPALQMLWYDEKEFLGWWCRGASGQETCRVESDKDGAKALRAEFTALHADFPGANC
ncbi:hypothetical protein MKEN_00284800 [Mycena kentingensis (nom. inval.)]|nr:hypothetical protein MKEN_00284800 [Mycena kentingensis (nom. inval.)]